MRDSKRIKPFLQELEKYWMKYPDLRFGQMIINFSKEICKDEVYRDSDVFNIEDNDYLMYIKDAIGREK
ncbi:hypothetical protein ACFHWD_03310 [Clostridium sp. MT-14]|uniref:hypothetical protein n=1 Tax=Clostridium sp. MT-14 TaxID=3348360 RepID=UPI0035F4E64C